MANRAFDEITGQEQLRSNDNINVGSNNPGQGTNFLQQAGEGMKHMVQGAATVAQGAVQGAANIAQVAADGASNIAHSAATTVRTNLGSDTDTTTTDHPSNPSTKI